MERVRSELRLSSRPTWVRAAELKIKKKNSYQKDLVFVDRARKGGSLGVRETGGYRSLLHLTKFMKQLKIVFFLEYGIAFLLS